MASCKRYYIKSEDGGRGPYTLGQLRAMWGSGAMVCDAFVREEKSTQWEPAIGLLESNEWNGEDKSAKPRGGIEPPGAHAKMLAVVMVFGLAALFLGYFHVVTGGPLEEPYVAAKQSFGFSETFINIDKIASMPWRSARIRFPLGCPLLIRENLIFPRESADEPAQVSP